MDSIFRKLGLSRDGEIALEKYIITNEKVKDRKAQFTNVVYYKNLKNGEILQLEEIYEKFRQKYKGYNFFQLLRIKDDFRSIPDRQIRDTFKTTEVQKTIRHMIDFEARLITKIAFESFPNGFDFYLCDEYKNILDEAVELSNADFPILLYGGSGTGKECIAHFIYKNSFKRNGKYRPISIVGLGEQFVHSELFGHLKGSFTGATQTRIGIIEECNGGTVFFDEIDKLELVVQAKLLRYLETQQYSKLGENTVRKSDCRFVFATSKNLLELVKEGKFLLDLYYRITGAVLKMPSLKDIIGGDNDRAMALFRFFFDIYRDEYGLDFENRRQIVWDNIVKSTDNLRLWFDYEWYGNLREFTNNMKRNLILGKWDDLPVPRKDDDEGYNVTMTTRPGFRFPSFAQVERDYMTRLMKSVNGIKKRAADISGLSLSTIGRKLKEHHIP